MTDVEPRFKQAKVKKPRKPLQARKRGTAASLKREATSLWGQVIHARDRACVVCGRSDGKLDAHHIVVREFNATRTDEANGVLLCSQHHSLGRESVHQDPHFAVCLYTRLLGVEGYEALRRKAYDGQHGTYGVAFWRAERDRLCELLEALS